MNCPSRLIIISNPILKFGCDCHSLWTGVIEWNVVKMNGGVYGSLVIVV